MYIKPKIVASLVGASAIGLLAFCNISPSSSSEASIIKSMEHTIKKYYDKDLEVIPGLVPFVTKVQVMKMTNKDYEATVTMVLNEDNVTVKARPNAREVFMGLRLTDKVIAVCNIRMAAVNVQYRYRCIEN